MTRFAILTVVAAVLTGSVFGQEPNEHLKGYAPFIGNWRYEGPVLEDIPNVAAKGSKCVRSIFRGVGFSTSKLSCTIGESSLKEVQSSLAKP